MMPELKAIGLLIQFRLLNDNSFFVNLQKFTILPYHIVVTKTGFHCHVLKHDNLICIRSTSRLELRLYCWQRVQICRKICGLGCVTRALVRAWFTQPSPNVYSCIFVCMGINFIKTAQPFPRNFLTQQRVGPIRKLRLSFYPLPCSELLEVARFPNNMNCKPETQIPAVRNT